MGCDTRAQLAAYKEGVFQSTHPRGVRPCVQQQPGLCYWAFQSTHPRGVRRQEACLPSPRKKFQSTHPRGVRPSISVTSLRPFFHFNPRTRVGCDWDRPSSTASRLHFNPRTRVGCDQVISLVHLLIPVFQSTHPRGVRLRSQARRSPSHAISIHAPAWGATCAVACWQEERLAFQSTHPRGVRPSDVCFKPIFSPFQSTHPRGVRPKH